MSRDYSQLQEQNARVFTTHVGACYPGSHAIFRGHDLHQALRAEDWVSLYVLGITGRKLSPEQVRMIHAIWVCTSYPDARLWNNRVGSMAATARSTPSLGISAALAVSEATVYGGKAGIRSIDFLQRCLAACGNDADAVAAFVTQELETHKRIYGYGRPINSTDERIPFVMDLARQYGLANGKHVQLAFEVERILVARRAQLKMNFAACHAALIADMGLSAREYQILRIPTFLAGMPPCFVEAQQQQAGLSFPTRCDAVAYHGVPARSWTTREK